PQGYYGCLNNAGELRFIWSSTGHRSLSLQNALSEFAKVRSAMATMAQKLYTTLKNNPANEKIDQDGYQMITNPLKLYSRPNLTFLTGQVGNLKVRELDAARLFNVSVYFEESFRTHLLNWIGPLMNENALFFCGTDWMKGIQSAFSTFRKSHGRLQQTAFSFSIDYLYPFRPWVFYSVHRPCYEKEA